MEIITIPVGYLKANCYLLNNNNQTLIIDPGDEANKIIAAIKYPVVGILITHNHSDHIGALKEIQSRYNAPVNNYELINFPFQVIPTPGHTKDSKTFYFSKDKIMFTGDFLFLDDIGRTDLPGGSPSEMISSLKKIAIYPDDIKIYPGHDRSTILGHEKNNFNLYY